ncbi:hypothetical protein Nepgr_031294 [Nepenthes gracilis]|uniref:Uncharacterized protein n=1 Tax=Nepenthes gracilis TaxID=150966 RepID=A0AAD3TI72_NEPGR|nr:hypothetical protein Nepgr_031294 [Nepenthes gracilis]
MDSLAETSLVRANVVVSAMPQIMVMVLRSLATGALSEGMYCFELFVSIPSCWFGLKNSREDRYGVPFLAPADVVPPHHCKGLLLFAG